MIISYTVMHRRSIASTCLRDRQCANKVDLQDVSELLDGLVHQHCMVGNAGIVNQSCQCLPLQVVLHLQPSQPTIENVLCDFDELVDWMHSVSSSAADQSCQRLAIMLSFGPACICVPCA